MIERIERRLSRRPDEMDVGTDEANWIAELLTLAAAIKLAWRETLQGIFKTGDLLIMARATVPKGQWLKYVREQLPFKAATARRLMKVASDKRLRQESHAIHLPICWYTLWDLTELSDEQFEKGIQTGSINPSMLRADVERLKGHWELGVSSSPRMADKRFSHKRLDPEIDPVLKTRVAYFNATLELEPDDNERELAACLAHFRHKRDDDDNEDEDSDDGD